ADSDPYINRNIYRTVSEFEDDIRFLSRNFSVFSAVDLIDMIASNKPFPKDTLVITFDDGLKINLEYQVPILKQYHITATFFLCSAFVDNKDLHYKRKVNLIVQKLLNEKDEALLRTIV